ncbi:uncharacterized protein LOC120331226 [Styela clava]
MIVRILTFFKHIILGIFRVIFWILRCGRRKKAAESTDDNIGMTDVVIGDAQDNYPSYNMNSTMMNGYEVPAPSYYDKSQQRRHPYQSQLTSPEQYQESSEAEIQMQSWDQWDYEDSSSQQAEAQNIQNQQQDPEEEEEINFFADMEPSVKVKKIVLKKKQKIQERSNRLAINEDLDFKTTSELDAWQDEVEESGEGWADDDVEMDDIDTDKIAKEARELRKQERIRKSEEQKKQRLAKKSKQHHDHRLGMKVS